MLLDTFPAPPTRPTLKRSWNALPLAPAGVSLLPFFIWPTQNLTTSLSHPFSHFYPVSVAKLKTAGGDNGTFLVRHRPEAGQWVLSVTYKGKPTHHLCKTDAGTNKVHVMNKNLADASTIEDLVARFAKKPLPQGWPVQLVLACNTDGSTGPPGSSSGGGGAAPAKKASGSCVFCAFPPHLVCARSKDIVGVGGGGEV